MTDIGGWIGVSHRVGKLMSYCILAQKVTVISRMTVQCITSLEKDTDKIKTSVNEFDTDISCRFKEEEDLTYDKFKPNPKEWSEYLE